MEFSFTDDQIAVRDAIAKLCEKHVKWEINGNVEIIGWNRANSFAEKPPSQLAVNLGFNEFRGRRKIQLTIQDSRV